MKSTPSRMGFRMPAEWEPHQATWMSWPHPEGISFPDSYEQVLPTFIQLIDILSDSERVCINVRDQAEQTFVEKRVASLRNRANVSFYQIPTEEPWCRDHGPIFVVRDQPLETLLLNWGYNAWGCKYTPFETDNAVPERIAALLNLEMVTPPMILEGGSIDVNGYGTLLTSESCLLNPNRNPTLSRPQIEQILREYLGVHQIIWLGSGIEGDDTDGHIDDITRFISRTTVVTVVEENRRDPNYEPLQANLARLHDTKIDGGIPLSVLCLPCPAPIEREGQRLPASYANFYIANRSVLLPVFNDPNDAIAIRVLEKAFPTRRIVPVDCRELIWGLGAIHCLTQQQPRPTSPSERSL